MPGIVGDEDDPLARLEQRPQRLRRPRHRLAADPDDPVEVDQESVEAVGQGHDRRLLPEIDTVPGSERQRTSRRRHRHPPPLRRGGHRRRCPRRGQHRLRARPLHRDHGPLGLGQVDPDAHPRRPRQADLRHGRARRRRHHRPRRRRADPAAPRQARLRLPVLQPAAGPDRRGEPRPAALDRRPQARRGLGRPADRAPSASRTAAPTARPSSPAASSSASPSPAPWSANRPSSSPTSRPATSTRSRAPT